MQISALTDVDRFIAALSQCKSPVWFNYSLPTGERVDSVDLTTFKISSKVSAMYFHLLWFLDNPDAELFCGDHSEEVYFKDFCLNHQL